MSRYRCAFRTVVLVAALAASAPAGAQGPAKPAKDTPRIVKFKHLRLDLTRRQVLVDAKVCLREGILEFLVCKTGSKEHESVLSTDAPGSQLHAALLALGLTPGQPARWSGVAGSGKFLPPRGPKLKLAFRWKDPQGKTHLDDAGKWLKSAGERQARMPTHWVFIGSEVLPDGKYWADASGEVISVANFASAVIDVPIESSKENALRDYTINTDAVPAQGTAVEVVITPMPDAHKSPHARVMLEIDPLGALRVAGGPILLAQLEKWAETYITKHSEGQVVIRADGRALVEDVRRVAEELRIGGVIDVEVTRLPPRGAILPRSDKQADRKLKWWADQFKNAKELLRDPGEQAEEVLKQVQADLDRLKATQAVWRDYARKLEEAAKKYKASLAPPAGGKER